MSSTSSSTSTGTSTSSGHGAQEQSDIDQAPAGITGPLVFSCGSCKTIVGDSYAFLCSNETLRTITLSAASNIERSADVFTSKGGFDVGSTYFSFACSNCHATIGRYYLTTSKDLDQVREKFTFGVEGLSTYEIGKAKFGRIPEPDVITFSADPNVDEEDGESDSSNTNGGKRKRIADLMDEILKVKHVMIDLMERVTALENAGGANNAMSGVVRKSKMQSVVTNISWVEDTR